MINGDVKTSPDLKLQGLNFINWTFDVITGDVNNVPTFDVSRVQLFTTRQSM